MGRSQTTRAGVAIAATLLLSGTAGAQTESERAERVALLRQADGARSAGRLEEALTLAQRAERIGVTAGTRLFISQVNAGLNRWAAARDGAEDCLRAVESDTQTSASNRRALRDECTQVRNEARQHLGSATATVLPNTPPSIDVVAPSRPVSPTPTTPVVAPRPAPTTLRAPQPSPASTVPPDEDRPSSTQRTLGWVGLGTGAALAIGAAVAGGVFQATESDYATEQCEVRPANTNPDCESMYGRFSTLNTLQWVGYVAGGVLAGTGVVLLLTAPRSHERPAPAISLGAGPGLLGASLSGRF